MSACGGHAIRIPDDVQGYDIVVTGRDSVSRAFARELASEGFRVRGAVRGGSRPTAVLVHFVFQEPNGPTLLHGRLADTRSGAIVAAASIPLDSTRHARRDSVPALVRALTAKGP
jgi:NAD(P)-dependent dehydrogenase (short-subunit alcohol dehydrogenase family)